MLIKKKLPLMIIVLVTVPLLLISFIIYNFTSTSLIKSSKDNIMIMTKLESDVFTALINKQKTEVELSAQKASVVRFANDRLEHPENRFISSQEALKMSNELKVRASKLPELEHSFILDLKGKVIADSNIIIKASSAGDRNYYKEAIKGNLNIGNTVYSKVDGKTVNVLAAPIRNEKGKVIGVFCNSFYTKYFENFTSSIKIGLTGYAYIIDDKDTFVTYPDKSRIGTKIINEKVLNIVDKIKDSKTSNIGLETYRYDNQNKYMGFCLIPDLKWTLIVAQNINEVNAPALTELYIIIGIFILMAAFSIIASIVASKSITDPIGEIIDTMNKTSSGDLNATCHYISNNELGQLSSNLNSMIEKLSISYNELAVVYDDLKDKEEELQVQYDELVESQEALTRSEERYKQALDGINDAVWELDIETNRLFTSDKWLDITGYKIDNTDVKEIIKKAIFPGHKRRMLKEIHEHIKFKTPYFRSEFKIISSDGEIKWILLKGKISFGFKGKPIKLTGSISDITTRKIAEDKIRQLAYYDALTNLPNRNTFIKELQDEVKKCTADGGSGAVIFIDLDDFKKVNDSLGHDIGDMLLKEISCKMNTVIDKGDVLSRFGGDEFVILKKNVKGNRGLEGLLHRLLKIFENCFDISGKPIFTTASIGISIFPINGSETNAILKNADTAMYKAKEAGKNSYQFYNEDMSKGLNRNMEIEEALRAAITKGNLELHYQPLIDLRTGKMAGAEGLLRLRTEELGVVSPSEFISVAEKTGLILPIGNWVIETACKQNMAWLSNGYGGLRISINVSSIQIKQPNFVEMVIDYIKKIKIPPEQVEIEITESILMESLETNVSILKRLKEYGIRTSLDDFGTGYSSLNYLRMIPINTLKIDKSFIDSICFDKKQEAIVDGIIKMAHEMEIEVVAEGVETKEQLDALSKKKCDIIQGYIFSKPKSSNDIEKILGNSFAI